MLRTLEQRKHEEAVRRAAVPQALAVRLSDFATRCEGRYLIYGSLARGEARYDSDVDIPVDFPAEFQAEAWRRVEAACADLRSRPISSRSVGARNGSSTKCGQGL